MFDATPVKPFPLYIRTLLSGEKCVLCREGFTSGRSIICPGCRDSLEKETLYVCSRCGAVISDCLCPTEDMKNAGIDAFIKLFPYYSDSDRISNRLLYRMKTGKDRMLSRLMASELAPRCVPLISEGKYAFEDICVTWIPRSGKRIRQTGTDQAKELAKALASALGVDARPLIYREMTGSIQKKLDTAGRAGNAGGLFGIRDEVPPCVILLDDLVTTGATVCACAGLLKSAGAGRVICVSLAHTVGKKTSYFPL